MRLYPKVVVTGQDFTGCPVVTVPNQSLSLQEILKRFVRNQPLPVEKDGIFIAGLGDLEKMAGEDIVDKMARVDALKAHQAELKARELEKGKVESPSVPPPPPQPGSGTPTPGTPPIQPGLPGSPTGGT